MSIFEMGMLICFGLAWPFNIIRSWRSKTAKGKSVLFLFILVAGYIFGLLHKFLYSPDLVIILYSLNLLMVSIDIVLFYRNLSLDKAKERELFLIKEEKDAL